jgi:hypothetical protein
MMHRVIESAGNNTRWRSCAGTAVAERALDHARTLQAEGAAATDIALARLDALEAEITSSL